MSTRPPYSGDVVQRYLPRILFTAVLLPILFFLGLFVHWRWSNASAIHRLEAKARKNGEPLTYAELAVMYPPIPDSQNGAAILMDEWEKDDPMFWKLFREGAVPSGTPHEPDVNPALPYLGSDLVIIERTNDISRASLDAADVYLREQREHFDKVRTALRYSKFWFPGITSERDPLLPHLAAIKREALNFSIEALIAGERGDSDTAVDSIEDTAHMGNALGSEPNTISQLVRLACYRLALDDMERLLSRRTLSIEQLDKLAKLVEELRAPGALRLAIIGERAAYLDVLNDSEKAPVLRVIKPMQSNRRILLTVCDRLISLGDADRPEVLREYDAIEVNRTNAIAKTNELSSEELSWGMLQNLESPAYRFARFETYRRTVVVALGVERYRMQHQGNLPHQLSDITPQYLKEIPLDILDGKPIRIKELPIGFVVGSSGIAYGDYIRAFPDTCFTIER